MSLPHSLQPRCSRSFTCTRPSNSFTRFQGEQGSARDWAMVPFDVNQHNSQPCQPLRRQLADSTPAPRPQSHSPRLPSNPPLHPAHTKSPFIELAVPISYDIASQTIRAHPGSGTRHGATENTPNRLPITTYRPKNASPHVLTSHSTPLIAFKKRVWQATTVGDTAQNFALSSHRLHYANRPRLKYMHTPTLCAQADFRGSSSTASGTRDLEAPFFRIHPPYARTPFHSASVQLQACINTYLSHHPTNAFIISIYSK